MMTLEIEEYRKEEINENRFPNQQKLNHLRKWYMNAEIRF